MKYDQNTHHITEQILLPVASHTMLPKRPPIPVAAIYDLQKREKPVAKPKTASWSLISKAKPKSVEIDPFMLRLSRLN